MAAANTPPEIVTFVGSAGTANKSDSLQLLRGTQVTLSWTISGADGVELDTGRGAPQRFDGDSGNTVVKPDGEMQNYSLVAFAGEVRSEPSVVHVSTHAEDEMVSEHAAVTSPLMLVWLAIQDDSQKPRANVAYTLRAGDAKRAGKTGASGELKAEIPSGIQNALLTLHGEKEESFQLVFDGSLSGAGLSQAA